MAWHCIEYSQNNKGLNLQVTKASNSNLPVIQDRGKWIQFNLPKTLQLTIWKLVASRTFHYIHVVCWHRIESKAIPCNISQVRCFAVVFKNVLSKTQQNAKKMEKWCKKGHDFFFFSLWIKDMVDCRDYCFNV